MKTVRVAVVGAGGRTGRLVLDALADFRDLHLVAAIVSPTSPLKNSTVAGSDVRYSDDMDQGLAAADVAIDFSRPATSVRVAEFCAHLKKAAVIATTGLNEAQAQAVTQAALSTPIVMAANTSFGVFVLQHLVRLATRMFGSSADIEIAEIHHRGKRDAPSGTAHLLANTISETRELRPIIGREGLRQSNELGMASLRGGDVAGEHTVYFFADGERIELTHRASHRLIFARGALRLAERIVDCPPGLKTVAELFQPTADQS